MVLESTFDVRASLDGAWAEVLVGFTHSNLVIVPELLNDVQLLGIEIGWAASSTIAMGRIEFANFVPESFESFLQLYIVRGRRYKVRLDVEAGVIVIIVVVVMVVAMLVS